MLIEKLYLQDGFIDFSGSEMNLFKYGKENPNKQRKGVTYVYLPEKRLPYRLDEILYAEEPHKFLECLKSVTENEEVFNILLLFLSLTVQAAGYPKRAGLFIGEGNTGKTTICNIIASVFTQDLVSQQPYFFFNNKYTKGEYDKKTKKIPIIIINDVFKCEKPLNSAFFKKVTAEQLVIMTSIYKIKFDSIDKAIENRLVVIPFKSQFKDKVISQMKLLSDLKPEHPAIIKHLVKTYIYFRDTLHSQFPISQICENAKSEIFGGNE